MFFFSPFALPFNKVGCTREYKTNTKFCFVFRSFALLLQQLSMCLLIVAYFHICSTF